MSYTVTHQVAVASESFVADLASIRFLSSVYSFVFDEVVFAVKPLVAYFAGIRLLASVCSDMDDEACVCTESDVTHITCEWFFVNFYMSKEITIICKSFVTYVTYM